MVFDPIHYLPLLEQKIAALDQAALPGHQTEPGRKLSARAELCGVHPFS